MQWNEKNKTIVSNGENTNMLKTTVTVSFLFLAEILKRNA